MSERKSVEFSPQSAHSHIKYDANKIHVSFDMCHSSFHRVYIRKISKKTHKYDFKLTDMGCLREIQLRQMISGNNFINFLY